MKFSSDLYCNLRKDTLPASPQHLRCARNAGQGTSVMAARVMATRMMAAETAVPPIMRAVSIVIAIVAGVGAEVRGGVGRGVWAICAARPMMAVGQAIFPSILVVKCTAGDLLDAASDIAGDVGADCLVGRGACRPSAGSHSCGYDDELEEMAYRHDANLAIGEMASSGICAG